MPAGLATSSAPDEPGLARASGGPRPSLGSRNGSDRERRHTPDPSCSPPLHTKSCRDSGSVKPGGPETTHADSHSQCTETASQRGDVQIIRRDGRRECNTPDPSCEQLPTNGKHAINSARSPAMNNITVHKSECFYPTRGLRMICGRQAARRLESPAWKTAK